MSHASCILCLSLSPKVPSLTLPWFLSCRLYNYVPFVSFQMKNDLGSPNKPLQIPSPEQQIKDPLVGSLLLSSMCVGGGITHEINCDFYMLYALAYFLAIIKNTLKFLNAVSIQLVGIRNYNLY